MHAETELALRRNKGRALQAAFLMELERALERTVDAGELTPIESTDRLIDRLRSSWTLARDTGAFDTATAIVETVNELRDAAEMWERRYPPREVYLLRQESEFCGALKIVSTEVLQHLPSLLTLDGEDVLACSQEGDYGITCQWTSPRWNRTDHELFEFFCWGAKSNAATPDGAGSSG